MLKKKVIACDLTTSVSLTRLQLSPQINCRQFTKAHKVKLSCQSQIKVAALNIIKAYVKNATRNFNLFTNLFTLD